MRGNVQRVYGRVGVRMKGLPKCTRVCIACSTGNTIYIRCKLNVLGARGESRATISGKQQKSRLSVPSNGVLHFSTEDAREK